MTTGKNWIPISYSKHAIIIKKYSNHVFPETHLGRELEKLNETIMKHK